MWLRLGPPFELWLRFSPALHVEAPFAVIRTTYSYLRVATAGDQGRGLAKPRGISQGVQGSQTGFYEAGVATRCILPGYGR